MTTTRTNHALEAACADIERQMRVFNERQRADRVTAHCPVAERIIANNPPSPLPYGKEGFTAIMNEVHSPAFYKRRAAEKIIHLRKNRLVCKAMGRNWRVADALILRTVRHCIEEARRLSERRCATQGFRIVHGKARIVPPGLKRAAE